MQATLVEQSSQATQTKKCPFCAEQIQAEAIKCRYCGEFLEGMPHAPMGPARPKPAKWYYSSSTLLMAVLCMGPLALPLVWVNPRYKAITKLVITAVVVVLTILLCQAAMDTYRNVMDQVKALGLQ